MTNDAPSQEYEFTAYHEAGHVVATKRWPGLYGPLRTYYVELLYDTEQQRFDGDTLASNFGLTDQQNLFRTLAGRVAELLVRSMGQWDVAAVLMRLRGGEYSDAQDTEHATALLAGLAQEEGERKQLLDDTVVEVYNYLTENWDAVAMVARDVLAACDPNTHIGRVDFDHLTLDTQKRLAQLAEAV